MTTDEILRDLFAERAEQRPNAADVLARVHSRDAHRGPDPRLAMAAAAAVAVGGIATGGVLVAGHHGHDGAGGAPAPSVSARSVAPHAATATPSVVPSPRAVPFAPVSSAGTSPGSALVPVEVHQKSVYDYSTIAAGWLPGPGHQVEADNSPTFEERDYDVTVDGVDMDVIIYLEHSGGLPDRTEAGSDGQDITVDGHPAREFVAENATIVAVDRGDGTIAYAGPSVVHPTALVTTARIAAIARHVAEDIEFGRHDPIPPQGR